MVHIRTFLAAAFTASAAFLLLDHVLVQTAYFESGKSGLAAHGFAPLAPPADAIEPSKDDRYAESNLAFVRRANQIIHLTTYHCEPTDFSLSLIERAVVTIRSEADVFSDGLLTDRMSCGFCHQRAYRLVRALRDAGLKADVFGIGGHVVARVLIDGKDYAVDPDYGVGPFQWSDDPATLTATVQRVYRVTVVPLTEENRATIAGWYTSTSDNARYEGLGTRDRQQQLIFDRANLVFYGTLTSSLAGLWYLHRNRSARRRPAVYTGDGGSNSLRT